MQKQVDVVEYEDEIDLVDLLKVYKKVSPTFWN